MLHKRNPQLNGHGELIHLLSIEGLPREVVGNILDTAGTFLSVNDRDVKKVPLLRGKSVLTCSSRRAPAPAPPSRSPPSGCRPMC